MRPPALQYGRMTGHRAIRAGRAAALATILAAVLASAATVPEGRAADGAGDPCAPCGMLETLAGDYAARAAALADAAQAARRAAAAANDPRRRVWPGPDSPHSDYGSFWLDDTARLREDARAVTAQRTADAVADIAAALADAAQRCRATAPCRRETPGAAPSALPETGGECVAFRAGPGSPLARLRQKAAEIERQNAACSAMACPVASCEARAALVEEAAFAHTLLSSFAALPGQDRHRVEVWQARSGDMARALAGLAAIAPAIRAEGVDRDGLRAAASRIAEAESALAEAADEAGGSEGAWRAVAAKLALAGVRDTLGRMQLTAAQPPPAGPEQEASGPGALAPRIAAAAVAVARLSAPPEALPAVPVCARDVRPLDRARERLAAALDGASRCSLRAGCEVHDAVSRGRARARVLVSDPLLPPALELVRALEEEVEVAASGAAPEEAARPVISFDALARRAGEALAVTVDPAGNRCLSGGGAVTLEPADAPPGEPGPGGSIARQPLAPADTPMLWEVPAPGAYAVAVHALPGAGGAELARSPAFVSRSEPARCEGWTGVWQTEFGRLVTVARPDGSVSGTYRRPSATQPGFLKGQTADGLLRGVWLSEIGEGGTRLRLMEAGSFRGTWGVSPRRETGGGVWTGVCIAGNGPG